MDDQKNDAASSPRATGGQVSQPVGRMLRAPESYRRNALDCAIKVGGSSRAEHIVSLALAFEAYLKDGTPASKPIPAPVQPPLPRSFADAAAVASSDCLYAIERVLRERARQVVKGYDANHDDEHTSEEMANQAASAIVSASSFVEGGPPFKRWIDYGQDRATVLVQGIALALAELERVHRANDRANTAERRASMDPADLVAEDHAKACYAEHVENTEYLTAARSHYAPIGELQGKAVNAIISDGLDDAPAVATMTPKERSEEEEVAQEVEPMTLQDFGKMHHALGNPRDALAETYRNHYAANREGEIAPRLRMFPKFWEEDDGQAPKSAMAFFSVTDAGRAALAKAMTDNPEHFRIDVENGPSAMPPADGD